KKLGYYTGEIDGSYGPLTEAAVKAFQKDQKLEQDGVFGPKTRAALEAVLKQHESDTGSVTKRLDELENMTKQIMEEINSIRQSIGKK
ncbi:MAG TPA: peptidoglycan-binding protein, partial [Clostridiales bacterium]|nr:peptidoglycan-binding protein [Clostridiales bacterium]